MWEQGRINVRNWWPSDRLCYWINIRRINFSVPTKNTLVVSFILDNFVFFEWDMKKSVLPNKCLETLFQLLSKTSQNVILPIKSLVALFLPYNFVFEQNMGKVLSYQINVECWNFGSTLFKKDYKGKMWYYP